MKLETINSMRILARVTNSVLLASILPLPPNLNQRPSFTTNDKLARGEADCFLTLYVRKIRYHLFIFSVYLSSSKIWFHNIVMVNTDCASVV